MLYKITDGTVSMGGELILSHIDFEIKGNEKIAIVGKNGVGKTSLLRLIAGDLSLDRDDKRQGPGIWKSRDLTLGMLSQTREKDKEKTVESLILEGLEGENPYSKDRYLYEMEYERIFTAFGFSKKDKAKKLGDFSGGEQTKISLIRLFLMKPDVLLLDEPTNHLDIPSTQWLETYIRNYEHAVVVVSHDRFFLDQVVDLVYDLQDKKLKKYAGNYTDYRKQKIKDLDKARKAYERQEQEVERLNGLIERFKNKPKKAAFARSKKKILERMELMEHPGANEAHIFTGDLVPDHMGSKWVYEAEHLKLGYDKVLLELSLRVRRGQKIGIIGDNGAGKSTFLRTVAGELSPLDGKSQLGNHILMGYFDQQSANLSSEKTVYEHFHDLFPSMTQKEVRSTLAAYLFSGREAQKGVDQLSGGEKSRLLLAELLSSKPNLLVLDEPTNHMDIPAKETLESAFKAYKGTMLFVSHDRYFVKEVADAILVFKGQKVMYYPFGYDHYLKHCREENEDLSALVQAEDQALIAGIRAVPEKEKHRLREASTEEAYLDWRFSQVGGPLEEAEDAFAFCWKKLEELKNEIEEMKLQNYGEDRRKDSETVDLEARYEDLGENLRRLWDIWTEKCLDWWEVYAELFPEEE